MQNNKYILDKNILTIKTECGEYTFIIDDDAALDNAQRIADVMIHEMEKVERKFNAKENSNSYAKILLANLNIADKYIQLENKYNSLVNKYKEMRAFYQRPAKTQAKTPVKSGDTPQDRLKKNNFVVKSTISDDQKNVNDILPEKKPNLKQKQTQRFSPKTTPDSDDNTDPVLNMKEQDSENIDIITSSEHRPQSFVQIPAQPSIKPFTESGGNFGGKFGETSVKESQVSSQNTAQAEARIGTLPEAQAEVQTVGLTETWPASSMQINPESVETSVPPASSAFSSSSLQLKIKQPEKKVIPFERPDTVDTVSDEFQLPSLDFLKISDVEMDVDHEAIRTAAEVLEQKLGYFGITGEVMEVAPGPVITTFEYKPAPGIKISKIVNLADDLALALSALSIRIVAPIPGKDVIGIEIPNIKKNLVPFIDIVNSDDFINIDSKLPICLGKDIIGNPVVVPLEQMPHLLIAGATGTGKSVGLNAMIASILYKSSPDDVKFIMIDPKRIELSLFNDIPHLITPVITDMKKANIALQWVVKEMERRYEILAKLQVRNIEQYNEKITTADLAEYDDIETFEKFSYIVVIIDELADLMMTAAKDIELSLTRIAQMARASGIHLILATQRPSVDVLTGIIKANFPTRISFQVSSKTDSRTIIDSNGAETLLGRGDMLFVPPGTARLSRVHGTYLSEDELVTITNFLKNQRKPEYVFEVFSERNDEPEFDAGDDDYDEKYQAALEFVLASRQASISGVQRALRVGYNRAARIIDLMEKNGIVGPSDGAKPRQVLTDRMF